MDDKKTILIVEDDEDIQSIYSDMIATAFDVELVQAFNGKEGLDEVQKKKPHLIILDLLMPVMNGEEFLNEFRYTMSIKDVPIVVCSVNQTLAHKLLRQKDVEAVLPKLFTQKDLVETVTQFLDIQPKQNS